MKVVTRLFFVRVFFYFLIEQFLLCLTHKCRTQSSYEMTQNAYIRPKYMYAVLLYLYIYNIRCHDCYRPLSFEVRKSFNVFRWLSWSHHFESCMVVHEFIDRYGISVSQMITDMFHLSYALPGPLLIHDLSLWTCN
jgi:hypothetical protein